MEPTNAIKEPTNAIKEPTNAIKEPTYAIKELFGEELLKRGEDKVTIEKVKVDNWLNDFQKKGKYIGLYFGAHWAPPCRLFTKNIEEKLYLPSKQNGDTKDLFEVVFVTDDREQGHYDRHILKMPWLSIPFDNELKK